jgi:hypothetical protein
MDFTSGDYGTETAAGQLADINETLSEVNADIEAVLDDAASTDLSAATPEWVLELAEALRKRQGEANALITNALGILATAAKEESQ